MDQRQAINKQEDVSFDTSIAWIYPSINCIQVQSSPLTLTARAVLIPLEHLAVHRSSQAHHPPNSCERSVTTLGLTQHAVHKLLWNIVSTVVSRELVLAHRDRVCVRRGMKVKRDDEAELIVQAELERELVQVVLAARAGTADQAAETKIAYLEVEVTGTGIHAVADLRIVRKDRQEREKGEWLTSMLPWLMTRRTGSDMLAERNSGQLSWLGVAVNFTRLISKDNSES